MNPFPPIRTLFDRARQLVEAGGTAWEEETPGEEEAMAFRDNSTRQVQAWLRERELTGGGMLEFVARHADFYCLRHTRLLREHKKMANLFAHLYLERRGAARERSPEEDYSLWAFVSSFCKPLERKRFHDHLYNHIALRECHPTREIMLVLWLHAWCFLFLPWVMVSRDYGALQPFRQPPLFPEPAFPFRPFFHRDTWSLEVLQYLSDPEDRAAPLRGFVAEGFIDSFRKAHNSIKIL